MKKIVLLICSLLLLSCSSKQVVTSSDRIIIDSTAVEKSVKERDTIIVVPASVAVIKLPVSELTEKPLIKKQGQATITLKRERENIIAQADCSELELQLKLMDSIIKTFKSTKETIAYHTPRDDTGNWYDGILKTFGFATLLLLGVFAIWILIQYFKK
jgi:hypothetical protein